MNDASNCEVLNRLWIIHHYSLPNYLAFAPPWWREKDGRGVDLLGDIVRDQQRLADRFGTLMTKHDCTPAAGQFPLRFTAFHDLSSQYIWERLVEYQQRTIEAIAKCIDQLPPHSLALSVTQESLGIAKAHLDSMNELHEDRLRAQA